MPKPMTISERQKNKEILNKATASALTDFNKETGQDWNFGTNWNSSLSPMFDTFVNKYLFPKIDETILVSTMLGNKFNWLAKEMDFITQFNEEYVIKDVIPVTLDLTKRSTLMLERNYPKMITKLYGNGVMKKVKFTLNNNDVRFNFSNLTDAISYAQGVYNNAISSINLEEEREMKAMLIDYAVNQIDDDKKQIVSNIDDLVTQVYRSFLYLQNNSDEFNEAYKASGGSIGRYTTVSDIEDLIIICSDNVKEHILNTKIANTYNIEGLDFTDKIISFKNLGGVYRLTSDVKITDIDTLNYLKAMGDYQIELNDTIPEGYVFTFDITKAKDFNGNFEEIKPLDNDLFAMIIDVNAIRYKRYTKNMLKAPFNNREFDEYTYWLHYYSIKNISPFPNKIVITKGATTLNDEDYTELDEELSTKKLELKKVKTLIKNEKKKLEELKEKDE